MKIPQEITTVAEHLGDLKGEVVFLGGMVRALLVTDPMVPGMRPTKDVDLIVDVSSLVKHHELLEKLRKRGFKEDMSEGAPICRYILRGEGPEGEDLPVDFMPLDASVLGFSNRWYPGAFQSANPIDSSAGTLRVIDAPHYLATKLESYAGRGAGDFYHHDLEDALVLVDGRESLVSEVQGARSELRDFVSRSVLSLLETRGFVDTLPGHLLPDRVSQARLPQLIARLQRLIKTS